MFRRFLTACFLVWMTAAISGTGRAVADDAALIKRIDDLEARVKAIEDRFGTANPLVQRLLDGITAQATGKEDLGLDTPAQPKFVATLISARLKNGFVGKELTVKFAVANQTGRDALIIDGSLVVSDILETQLGRFEWQDGKGIKAGATVTMSGTYSQLGSISGDLSRIAATDPKLLRVTFDVEKIAYADGEKVFYK